MKNRMMNRKSTLIISLLIALATATAEARDREAPPETATVVAPTVTNEDYRQSAENAAAGQKSASQTGQIVGTGLFIVAAAAAASYNYGYAAAAAAGGILAYKASGHNASAGYQSQQLACQMTNSCTKSPDADPTKPAENGAPSSTDAATNKAIADLKKAGITVDFSKGTVSSGGKSYDANSIASADSMEKAGLNPKDFAKLQAEVKGLEKKAAASVGTDNSDFSVAAGAGGGSETARSLSGDVSATGAKDNGLSRDPAQVAGLQTMYNGEPIGVATDSLFGIVDRRYELHQQKGSFLTAH